MTIVVVVGTGTGVGKTVATTRLVAALRREATTVAGWKPIESGGSADSDAIAEASGRAIAPLHAFEEAVGPHLAARRHRIAIEIAPIVARAKTLAGEVGTLIVETAGGLFSPLDDRGTTNAELVRALDPELVILVAPDRLGVLHDVEAVRRAAAASSVRIDAAIVSRATWSDASVGHNLPDIARTLPAYPMGDALDPAFMAWARGRLAASHP